MSGRLSLLAHPHACGLAQLMLSLIRYIFLTLHNASASHIKKRLKVSELIYFFRQLLRTVHALHVLSVSHEDIKRSNILFSKSGSPVLVDFGFSHFKSDGGKVKSAGGTLDYSSPEKVEVCHPTGHR